MLVDFLKLLANEVVPVLLVFIVSFLSYLIKKGVAVLESKFEFTKELELEKRAMGLLNSGVLYAEQKARDELKAGNKLASNQKLELAMGFVRSEAKRMGVNDWVFDRGEDLAKLLESRVAKNTSK